MTVSLAGNGTDPPAFLDWAQGLPSDAVRAHLGDPILESLAAEAAGENRSLSNLITTRLRHAWANETRPTMQLQLDLTYPIPTSAASRAAEPSGLGLTFRHSKTSPIHRWYPYVEGFSARYAAGVLDRYPGVRVVYDPFAGAGTTLVEASWRGLSSFFSEVNPFMRAVACAKVNSAAEAQRRPGEFAAIADAFLEKLTSAKFETRASKRSVAEYQSVFSERDFFELGDLRRLLCCRDLATEPTQPWARDLLRLAVLACTVDVSNMARRADLRRRRPDEYKGRVVDVASSVATRIRQMVEDLQVAPELRTRTELACEDARRLSSVPDGIDLLLTSPPYVNGTNYFRNTKLELWLGGWLTEESQLAQYRRAAITAGINNVTRGRTLDFSDEQVEVVAQQIAAQPRADKRIPEMIRGYFNDMFAVLSAARQRLRPSGRAVLDIGDSRFYGVHVPADELLVRVAEQAGYRLESDTLLARRHSRDKSELRQVELVLAPAEKSSTRRGRPVRIDRPNAIGCFSDTLPYTQKPYSSRAWGSRWHSLCSYQGKLKPAIAHWLVREFTQPGDVVLDPLGGVGTVAFEACLQGRLGVTNDLSPLAATVARAKVQRPSEQVVRRALHRLRDHMRTASVARRERDDADFGLNSRVRDYFHPRTLTELLKARSYFRQRNRPTDGDAFVEANLLHILHGNRPYALSRTSHPITPFQPKGDAEYKDVLAHLERRVEKMLGEDLPDGATRGRSLNLDFFQAGADFPIADAIITSPPFLGMRFDRPNWLRLWFCGWNASDFHHTSRAFLDRRQSAKDLSVYDSFFRTCVNRLRPGGLLVVHLGGSDKHAMVERVCEQGGEHLHHLGIVSEDVRDVGKHGLTDKGLTTTHNFLFYQRDEAQA